MAEYPEKEMLFRSALRQQILGRSQLVRQELSRGTKFLYSEQYPTQVLNTQLGRFIRINQSDINEESISNLLKVMMAMDSYYTIPEHTIKDEDGNDIVVPEETQDLIEVIDNAVETVLKVDFTDVKEFDSDYADMSVGDEEIAYEDDLFTYDKFGNIQGHTFDIQPQVVHKTVGSADATEFDPSNLEILDETVSSDTTSSDITEEASSLADAMGDDKGSTTTTKDKRSVVTQVEQAFEDLPQFKNVSRFHDNTSILTKKDILKLQPKVKQLLKAFKGTGDQIKKVSPTKRISSKDIACDRDKCYVKKADSKGKHIKLNFLIDMSGSMGGNPVKNAVRLVYLFNQLAKEGYVTMSVLYSTTSTNYKLDLPASDAEILSLCRTQSAEGLAKTIHAHADTIKGTNTICLTDGDIVDEPIDKMFWAKHKSISTGVYVNKSLTSYTEYTGKLNKWFNHSVVRKSLDELIEWLIRVGLKG